jgi:hypothetical protein
MSRKESKTKLVSSPVQMTMRPKKERFTTLIDQDMAEKARDACYWTPGLTLSLLFTRAITKEIAELEKRRGKPFSKRQGPPAE